MALPNLISPISITPSSIYNTGIIASVDNIYVNGTFFTVPANTVYILKRSAFYFGNPGSSRLFYTGRDSGIPNIINAFNGINMGAASSPFVESGNRIFLENESFYYKINTTTPMCIYFEIDIYK